MAILSYTCSGGTCETNWALGGSIPVSGLCTNENVSEVIAARGLTYAFGGSNITYVRDGGSVVDVLSGRIASLQVTSASPAEVLLTVSGLKMQAAQVFDLLHGGSANALWVHALRGADQIAGTDLRDRLQGYGGNDLIEARAGNDTLAGGAGQDTMAGGDGVDRMIGGAEADTFVLDDRNADGSRLDQVADLELGVDHLSVSKTAFAEAFALCTNEDLSIEELVHFGPKAKGAHDMFLVTETALGIKLSYDADANGAGKAQSFTEIVFTAALADGDTSWVNLVGWDWV